MYKNKQIKFKFISDTQIEVYMEYEDFKDGGGFEVKRKKVGQIFSPAGSGNNVANAIQVCGISEAFEYWGCGAFAKPKQVPSKPNSSPLGRKYYYDRKGNPIMEQVRDIQLYFDEDTQVSKIENLDCCMRCFNVDCTCDLERKKNRFMFEGNLGKGNPFVLKRETDIPNLRIIKKKE